MKLLDPDKTVEDYRQQLKKSYTCMYNLQQSLNDDHHRISRIITGILFTSKELLTKLEVL